MEGSKDILNFYYSCAGLSDVGGDVEHHLLQGVPVNARIPENNTNYPGYTPLHLAARKGDATTTKLLLRYGADVNIKDADGYTPLHLAFQRKAFDIVDVILEYQPHIDITKTNCTDDDGLSYFHIACTRRSVSVVEKFINEGVSVNDTINTNALYWAGYTALHFAVQYSSSRMVELLISRGANLDAREAAGCTPLHLIALTMELEKVYVLLNAGADVNAQTKYGDTVALLAAKVGEWELVEELVMQYGADVSGSDSAEQYTLLHFACLQGVYESAAMLLNRGAEINVARCVGITPLHSCVLKQIELQNSEVTGGKTRILVALLNRGCNPNSCDSRGRTPLHYACIYNDVPAVRYLLVHGANIDSKDMYGYTPTHCYVECKHNNYRIAIALVSFVEILRIGGMRKIAKEHDYVNLLLKRHMDTIYVERIANQSSRYCWNELNRLKEIVLDPFTTLDQLLIKSVNEMTHHVKNTKIQRKINGESFTKDFPIYGRFIKRQYDRGCKRECYLVPAKEAFISMTECNFPDICLEKIFDCLDDSQLADVIKASELED